MVESPITTDLADQLARVWDMIVEAVSRFPVEHWQGERENRMQPARIAYHLLMTGERYTWEADDERYIEDRVLANDWVNSPAEEFPGKSECMQMLQDMKVQCIRWAQRHGDAGLTTEPAKWPWTGSIALGQAMYMLRHFQHHMAELNLILRTQGLRPVKWK